MIETGLVDLERRVGGAEENLKAVNNCLKEQQQSPSGVLALRERARLLSAELEASRKSRRNAEEQAQRLRALLKEERFEREAWLAAFMAALQNTLQELNTCVDQSIADSSKLMRGRLDVAENMMTKLIGRVDQIFSLREQGSGEVPSTSTERPPHPVGVPPSSNASVVNGQAAHQLDDTGAGGLVNPLLAGGVPAQLMGESIDILKSWTELLNENLRLQQRHHELIHEKQKRSSAENSRAGSADSRGPGGRSISPRKASLAGATSFSTPGSSGNSPTYAYAQGTRPRSGALPGQLPSVAER